MQFLGRHLLLEFFGCNEAVDSPDAFRAAIPEAVEAIGATLLNLHVHTFSPQGVTGLAVLAESHMSLHSWPEHRYLAADVFTCGDRVEPLKAIDVLRRHFRPARVEVLEIERGRRAPDGAPPRVSLQRSGIRKNSDNVETVSKV
jgi:S-adenosylmethionine decarboxylase